jgi:hypothetical protein
MEIQDAGYEDDLKKKAEHYQHVKTIQEDYGKSTIDVNKQIYETNKEIAEKEKERLGAQSIRDEIGKGKYGSLPEELDKLKTNLFCPVGHFTERVQDSFAKSLYDYIKGQT